MSTADSRPDPDEKGGIRVRSTGMRSSTLVNRNVTIRGRRTSLRLEPAMWDALNEIARRENASIHDVCARAGAGRGPSTLTAAIRVHILGYFREAATEQGHSRAGHGRRGGGTLAGPDPEISPVNGAGVVRRTG